MTREIWKEIPNCKGYKISNFGRIKSFLSDNGGKILKTRKDKDGYLMVGIKCNSAMRVHRAVALTFLSDEYRENLVVNHKNGIKDDNRVDNLEWCTISQNTKHGYDADLSHSANSTGIAVMHNNELISVFNSYNKLSTYTGINRNSISNCIKNNKPIFDELYLKKLDKKKYNDHPLFENKFVKNKLSKYQLKPCKYGDKYFESIKQLSEELGCSRDKVAYALRNDRMIDDVSVKFVTRYEYIKQCDFND